MKTTLVSTSIRVLRDHAAAAAAVERPDALEAHKLGAILRYFKTGDLTRRSRHALHPFG